MAQKIQLRRGTRAALAAITPSAGEPCWAEDTQTLWIGDGITAGGIEVGGTTGEEGGGISNIVSIARVADQTATSGAATWIAFDQELEDAGGAWSSDTPTRITVPAGQGGLWKFTAHYFVNTALSGQIQFGTRKNGSVFAFTQDLYASGSTIQCVLGFEIPLAAGDYLEFFFYHNTGTSKTVRVQTFTAYRLPS